MKELEPFKQYEILQDKDEIFVKALWITQAILELQQIKKDCFNHLIRTMKNQNIQSWEVTIAGEKNKVYYSNNKKETITNPKVLENMLFNGTKEEREMARNCISFSASRWETGNVRTMFDTLGKDVKEVMKTDYLDEVSVKIIPIKKLKGGK